MTKIAVGSDHRGYQLKEIILNELVGLDFSVRNYGIRANKSGDYPDYASAVAKAISKNEVDCGILICGTGIGMCIVANRFPNVRAAVAVDSFLSKIAKEQFKVNCLCLSADQTEWKSILTSWLKADFSGNIRHTRQLEKIEMLSREPKYEFYNQHS